MRRFELWCDRIVMRADELGGPILSGSQGVEGRCDAAIYSSHLENREDREDREGFAPEWSSGRRSGDAVCAPSEADSRDSWKKLGPITMDHRPYLEPAS